MAGQGILFLTFHQKPYLGDFLKIGNQGPGHRLYGKKLMKNPFNTIDRITVKVNNRSSVVQYVKLPEPCAGRGKPGKWTDRKPARFRPWFPGD